jgi:serine/threonine protein kinase
VVGDRYEIRVLIGSGGMGQVFLAHDRKTDKDVALKTLHGKYAANHAAVARFVREVTLTRQLDHPGIARLHETHNWNGTLFYTMDYVEGKTLRRWLSENKRLDFGSAVRVLCLVADVLEHAHRITIHRDLSPENIMVLADGSVRLLDFGLAKLDDKFKGLTMVGANIGKMMYMAPEQELDAAGVDHRADLYSLGVILFELLVGRTPLPGRKLRDFRPDLPPEIDGFLSRALARKPDDRFGSAREFRDALLGLYKLHKAREAGLPTESAQTGIAARIGAFFRRIIRAG